MSDSYIQQLFAERIGGVNYGKSTAIYKFEKIKRAKVLAPVVIWPRNTSSAIRPPSDTEMSCNRCSRSLP